MQSADRDVILRAASCIIRRGLWLYPCGGRELILIFSSIT